MKTEGNRYIEHFSEHRENCLLGRTVYLSLDEESGRRTSKDGNVTVFSFYFVQRMKNFHWRLRLSFAIKVTNGLLDRNTCGLV